MASAFNTITTELSATSKALEFEKVEKVEEPAPNNLTWNDLSFAFTLSPKSGIAYHKTRNDIEFLISGNSTLTLSRYNKLTTGQYTTNVTNILSDDEGSVIQPMVYDVTNRTINDQLKPPIMCISGFNDFGGEPAKIKTYESSGLFVTSVDIYYPWERSESNKYMKLQAKSDTAQILIGPRHSMIPGGQDGEAGEVYANAGNILLIGASTDVDYVESGEGGDGGGGDGTPSYEKGGSVYLLSGEGGKKSGEVLIATHDVQNWRLGDFTTVATENTSGDITLQTGIVPDWHNWNVSNGGWTGVGLSEDFPWTEMGKSGNINLVTGDGSASGEIILQTGKTNTFSTNDSAVYATDAGNIKIIGGDISNTYTFTGPGPRHAGSVLIKGGDITDGVMSGISAGEVILKPGSLGNISGIPNQALVRIACSSGLQIPYGSQVQRPATNDNNQYQVYSWSDAAFPMPELAAYESNVDTYIEDGNVGVGVLRVSEILEEEDVEAGPIVPGKFIEMFNGVDWQRFYSEDFLTHKHHQTNASNIWTIEHNKELIMPVVSVWVFYDTPPSGIGVSAGYKTLDPSLYEVYCPNSDRNTLYIKFSGTTQYYGFATIKFAPQNPFVSGFAGGNGRNNNGRFIEETTPA